MLDITERKQVNQLLYLELKKRRGLADCTTEGRPKWYLLSELDVAKETVLPTLTEEEIMSFLLPSSSPSATYPTTLATHQGGIKSSTNGGDPTCVTIVLVDALAMYSVLPQLRDLSGRGYFVIACALNSTEVAEKLEVDTEFYSYIHTYSSKKHAVTTLMSFIAGSIANAIATDCNTIPYCLGKIPHNAIIRWIIGSKDKQAVALQEYLEQEQWNTVLYSSSKDVVKACSEEE